MQDAKGRREFTVLRIKAVQGDKTFYGFQGRKGFWLVTPIGMFLQVDSPLEKLCVGSGDLIDVHIAWHLERRHNLVLLCACFVF